MRKAYWYISAYIRKHGWVVLLSLLGAIIVFSVVIPLIIDNLQIKKRRHIGIVGTYTLDALPEEITTQLSAGLTSIAEDGSAIPHLAERWLVNEDATEYTFELKKDLFWQDARPLSATDITYSYPDVNIITKDGAITYQLKDAYAPFPAVVSTPLIRIETERGLLGTRKKIIGIGTTNVSSYKLSKDTVEQITLNTPTELRVYRFYPSETQAVASFKHGEVDELAGLSRLYDVSEWQNVVTTAAIDERTYVAVFFNNESPLFSKNIRQALAFAAKKPESGKAALGPISPQSWAYLSGLKPFTKDTDRATERILDELPPERIAFQLQTSPLFIETAELLKSEWEAFGDTAVTACKQDSDVDNTALCDNLDIAVTIRVTNFPDTQNFEALLAAQSIPADPDQYSLWHSQQPTNFTGYKNVRIDKLLEEGRQVVDQKKRREIYQEFQQFFVEDAAVIFLDYLPQYSITRD